MSRITFDIVPFDLDRWLAAHPPKQPTAKRAGRAHRSNGSNSSQPARTPWEITVGSSGEWTPERRAIEYLGKCESAVSGKKGHNSALWAACQIGPGFDLEPEVTFQILRDHFNERCDPPWSEAELRHKVDEAYKKESRRGWLRDTGREQPSSKDASHKGGKGTKAPEAAADLDDLEFEFTDLGNAQRLVHHHGQDLRYCALWKSWLHFDGKQWCRDNRLVSQRLATLVPAYVLTEIPPTSNQNTIKAFKKWAEISQSRSSIDDMIKLARSEPGIPIMPDDLDTDPWLFNVQNGTVDLRTGELHPHRREDLITKISPVAYDPDATAPRWERFELDIFAGDEELIHYMRRCVGYALTAVDSVQEINILFGDGSNGKNLYLDTIRWIMGNYAKEADNNLLVVTANDQHPTGLADLAGMRFVTASETEDGCRFAEALVKQITGNAIIKARRMREDFFEFKRTFKIFLATNYKPKIKGRDSGIWRRIRLIPFAVKFVKPEDEAKTPIKPPLFLPIQKDLDKRLMDEAQGILALMVRGCLEWRRIGMSPPKAVIAATEQYKAEGDLVQAFIDECCESFLDRPHVHVRTRTDALYLAYTQWCKSSGIDQKDIFSRKKFGDEIGRKGFAYDESNSRSYRKDIRIRENQTPSTPSNPWEMTAY